MKKTLTYEQATKRLDEIIKQIENGETDIDSLTANLKEAMQLVAFCKEKLTSIETEAKKCLNL